MMMKKLTLNIPVRTSDDFGAPINEFLDFAKQVENESYDKVEFDFSKVRFLSPILIAGLCYLITKITHQQSVEIVIIDPQNDSIKDYLETVFFPKGLNNEELDGIQSDTFLEKYNEKTFTPIANFPTTISGNSNENREKIIGALENIITKQLNLSGSFKMGMSYLVAELTQNIVDHSSSEKGWIFAQFFPSKNFMDVCIFDSGKGLFQSYIDRKKHSPRNDAEALNFAVYGRSTKDLPESRGFGLSTSRNMLVNGLKGKFFMMSGDSFFIQTVDREEIITVSDLHLKGCFIVLRIPILNTGNFNLYDYLG